MAPHPPPTSGKETWGAGAQPGAVGGSCSGVGLAQLLTSLPPHPASPQFRCTPPTPVDMIFLVDGSWSIGHSHFQQVKDFLASVIEPFEIGPNKVQVGRYQPPALWPCCQASPLVLPAPTGGPTLRNGKSERRHGASWGNRRTARPIGITGRQHTDPPARPGRWGLPQGLGDVLVTVRV